MERLSQSQKERSTVFEVWNCARAKERSKGCCTGVSGALWSQEYKSLISGP